MIYFENDPTRNFAIREAYFAKKKELPKSQEFVNALAHLHFEMKSHDQKVHAYINSYREKHSLDSKEFAIIKEAGLALEKKNYSTAIALHLREL